MHILTVDSYSGFLARLSATKGAQAIFVGRVTWPGLAEPEDAIIKLYRKDTCGIANEVIGFEANLARGVSQPRHGAVLLLPKSVLPDLNLKLDEYVDAGTGICACWATSFEQGAEPFKFIRKLSSFSQKQTEAFYKSKFCKLLAGVDYVTGNNDRHEGNFLYKDDLNYLAIDQGCVGGGLAWHSMWPDPNPINELALLAQKNLTASHVANWQTEAIIEYQIAQESWRQILPGIENSLSGIIDKEHIDTIIDYMSDRANSHDFAKSCGRLV